MLLPIYSDILRKYLDTIKAPVRYSLCEVGLAMCHSTGSIGDTLIDPFYSLPQNPMLWVLKSEHFFRNSPKHRVE